MKILFSYGKYFSMVLIYLGWVSSLPVNELGLKTSLSKHSWSKFVELLSILHSFDKVRAENISGVVEESFDRIVSCLVVEVVPGNIIEFWSQELELGACSLSLFKCELHLESRKNRVPLTAKVVS